MKPLKLFDGRFDEVVVLVRFHLRSQRPAYHDAQLKAPIRLTVRKDVTLVQHSEELALSILRVKRPKGSRGFCGICALVKEVDDGEVWRGDLL